MLLLFIRANMIILKSVMNHDGGESLFILHSFHEPLSHVQNNHVGNVIVSQESAMGVNKKIRSTD